MNARSLGLPPLTLEVNGRPMADKGRALIGEVRVSQKLSLPAQCEISFFSEPGADVTASLLPGASLLVAVGDDPPFFSGEITAFEYAYEPNQGRRLRVRGYDRLHRLRKRQPVRAHVQIGLAELARELVSGIGISVEAPSASLVWLRLIQHGQTDFDLLAQTSEACGVYFTLRGETLHLLTLEGIGDPIQLLLGETLLEARIEVNLDHACREVFAGGWDPLRAEEHEGRANEARVGRSASAGAPPRQVGGTAKRRFVNLAVQDDAHAEALAQAELDLRAARQAVLRGTAEGDPRLRPGSRVDVRGVATTVAGRYVLTEVTHVLDGRQGFVSEISSYPSGLTPRYRGTTAALGRVTSVNDPDGLGRVQVALPACNNVETHWMGVVTAGAGANKGWIALPDVGDTVLVLCAQENPAMGVVLGGLYGAGGPPDAGVEGGAVKRFTFRTPGGQWLRFDDGEKTLQFQNADGSSIELGPARVVLHAAADLRIEAPGKRITVCGNAIDFEQG